MYIGIPQAIVLIFYIICVVVSLVKHGEPITEKWNFPTAVFTYGCLTALLYWGGFFG